MNGATPITKLVAYATQMSLISELRSWTFCRRVGGSKIKRPNNVIGAKSICLRPLIPYSAKTISLAIVKNKGIL